MSTTALVRSSSSSNSLTAPTLRVKQASPSGAISASLLPKQSPTTISKLTPSRTSTPQQQTASPAISTPGRWQHPRMNEIIRRQNRANFDSSNVYAILWNVLFLFVSFAVHPTLNTVLPRPSIQSLQAYTTYTLLLLRLFFTANIAISLSPLFRKQDACEDIPLTPSQRQLLGLPPMSRPSTPLEQEQWVTPPRYSRSATPRSSPASLSNSPAYRSVSGSPLTTATARQGVVDKERRRLSYSYSNRSSPLSISEFDAVGGSVNTPTKSNGLQRASVGLNSKWLYEKGKASTGGAWGSSWGSASGSTFS